MNVTRRMHPPDRRTPVPIQHGQCPAGQACGCCPGHAHRLRKDKAGRLKHRYCPLPHPGDDRPACRPPIPRDIPPCAERDTFPSKVGPLACCVECGRVTPRRWVDPLGRATAWCAGG